MATIKSYSDLQQSKKLAEILPLESADMYYCYSMDIYTQKWEYDTTPTVIDASNQIDIGDIPCWSLAALLSVLPYGYSSILTKSFNGKDYYCMIDGKPFETTADNPVDACFEMILKLYELKML